MSLSHTCSLFLSLFHPIPSLPNGSLLLSLAGLKYQAFLPLVLNSQSTNTSSYKEGRKRGEKQGRRKDIEVGRGRGRETEVGGERLNGSKRHPNKTVQVCVEFQWEAGRRKEEKQWDKWEINGFWHKNVSNSAKRQWAYKILNMPYMSQIYIHIPNKSQKLECKNRFFKLQISVDCGTATGVYTYLYPSQRDRKTQRQCWQNLS